LVSDVRRYPEALALLSLVDVCGWGSIRVITPTCTVGLLIACIEVSLATHRRKFWLALNGKRLDVPLSTRLWTLWGVCHTAGVFTTHLTCLEVEPANWVAKQHLDAECHPLGPWQLHVMDYAGAITTIGVDPEETWVTVQATLEHNFPRDLWRSRLCWRGVPLRLTSASIKAALARGIWCCS
jgi:hypothetical protein